jgi:hypothetical protein
MTENDFNVLYRGRRVGRIDLQPNPEPDEAHVPWRWFLDYGREFEMSDPRRGWRTGVPRRAAKQ